MNARSLMINPYVGLRPYESEDSLYYFGRSEQTKNLLSLLHQHRFVAVVGSSGCGKSSLVRAGLIPHLEAGFLVQERDQWQIATMKPGEAPLDNLISTITAVGGKRADAESFKHLHKQVRERGVLALVDALGSILPQQDANLLLMVDQFEELFRFSLDQNKPQLRHEAEEFVALLLGLSRQRQLPIFICLTMRSDFLGDCDAFYRLPEAINQSQFLVPRLTRDQRREAIVNPTLLAGGLIAPRLVDLLLNENIDTRDDLPILQHLLMRCWDAWQAGPNSPDQIDLAHYHQVHTIHQALNDHADEALAELDVRQQRLAKQLFQALTCTDESNRRIRRPAHLSDVRNLTGATTEELQEVVDAFIHKGRSFLVKSPGKIPDDILLDISHESLIRQWNILGEWVEEEAEAFKTYRRLVETAELHTEKASRLYRGADLTQAMRWRDEHNAIWAQRYPGDFDRVDLFLEQSLKVEKEEERKAEEIQKKIKAQTDRANFFAAKAFEEKAINGFKKAEISLYLQDYQDAWLYMLEAMKQHFNPDEMPFAPISIGNFARIDMLKTFAAKWFSPTTKTQYHVASVAFSPDGKLMASGSWNDNCVRLWRVSSGENIHTFKEHDFHVTSVAFSPDGKLLASGSWDKTVRIWDISSRKLIYVFKGHTKYVSSVAFSPDSKLIASGSWDREILLWDIKTFKLVHSFKGHRNNVTSITFSPNGNIMASGSWDNEVRLWDINSRETIHVFKEHRFCVSSVTFSRNGDFLASGSWDQEVLLWDVKAFKMIRSFKGHRDKVSSIAFSPDGNILASGSWDNEVRLWDVKSGKTTFIIKGHTDQVFSVAFSPDGKLLATGSRDTTVRLWDIEPDKAIPILTGHDFHITSASFSPDGKLLATGSGDRTIRLWDVESWETIHIFDGHDLSVQAVAISPNGQFLASGSWDKRVRVWSLKSFKQVALFEGHTDRVTSVAFNGDGKFLASSSVDKTVRLWDVYSPEKSRVFDDFSEPVNSVASSPAGRSMSLVSASKNNPQGRWTVYDNTVKYEWEFKKTFAPVHSVAFSLDGNFIAGDSMNNSLCVWDALLGNPGKIFQGHSAPITSVAFSPDGKFLISGSKDNTIRLWDTNLGEMIHVFENAGEVLSIAYSPDGKFIVSGSWGENFLRIWDLRFFKAVTKMLAKPNLTEKVSAAFQFFWERSLKKGITFVHDSRKPSLSPTNGYYLADVDKFGSLLKPPAPGETKLDQVMRWAEEEVARETKS
ncbi:MAG: hypothetical protein KKC76_11230 [Proteobacteria bacterium]|nr:hypothetical protein [Pseudomonadota bacterium]MBU4296755.1 hypothetical protein [Pseudomonadota bacterium]MCG2745931.1 hypothetical protein [Desulfobulbaceae bacterium]